MERMNQTDTLNSDHGIDEDVSLNADPGCSEAYVDLSSLYQEEIKASKCRDKDVPTSESEKLHYKAIQGYSDSMVWTLTQEAKEAKNEQNQLKSLAQLVGADTKTAKESRTLLRNIGLDISMMVVHYFFLDGSLLSRHSLLKKTVLHAGTEKLSSVMRNFIDVADFLVQKIGEQDSITSPGGDLLCDRSEREVIMSIFCLIKDLDLILNFPRFPAGFDDSSLRKINGSIKDKFASKFNHLASDLTGLSKKCKTSDEVSMKFRREKKKLKSEVVAKLGEFWKESWNELHCEDSAVRTSEVGAALSMV